MRIGVLGAGQLGQMLAQAAPRLGISLRFLSPDENAPAGRYGELVVADYANQAAVDHFLDGLDAVTYEFENIPAEVARAIAERVVVRPPVRALETAQDRAYEKECFKRVGIPTSEFAPVGSMREIQQALETIGYPAVLKSRRLGYDGKGQAIIRLRDEIPGAWVKAGAVPSIVESWVRFSRELSIIGVRSITGETAFYPLAENHHSDGILRFSLAPAPSVAAEAQATAEDYARRLMEDLDYAGVLAVELFETPAGLVANEMAPRVHNTGHWTIEGADTSQFENHLRAIAGLPLGSTEMGGAAGMINLIGTEPNLARLASVGDVHVHMYGKAPKPGRKLGHITVVADDLAGVRDGVQRLRHSLAR